MERLTGYGVVLTIDARIQRVTEAALVRAWQSTEAAGAYAVVMDVETFQPTSMRVPVAAATPAAISRTSASSAARIASR